ncbi:MAG: YceI family protein [Rhodocyclaceae bacterium]|jgi:polyisoprenoid-binding protein YceI|nr:YceI family protein [Rhodocyclaceae bacterium]
MKRLCALLFSLSAIAPAQAIEFNAVQADKSSVSFVFRQMGVAVDGRFRKFNAQLAFDPAKPQASRAALEIDLASVDAGSAEANDEVATRNWFNTKAFPTARFVADAVRAQGGDRYELSGKLTLKGRTQTLSTPLTFRKDGALGVFDGSLTIKRADFAIGEGEWAAFDTVANEIQVRFHIVAAATK